MQKPWLNSYPAGVHAEVDLDEFASIPDLFEQSITRFRQLPAYSNMGRTLSYDEVDRMSAAFGAFLQQELGLERGDRVAIMMPNLLQDPISIFGVLRAGLIVVNTNPLYTPRELRHQLQDSGAKAIVLLENFAHVLEEVLDDTDVEHIITTRIGDMLPFPKSLLVNLVVKHVKKMVPAFHLSGTISFMDALKIGENHTLLKHPLTHDDIAFLQYTGGTTGVAKGAMLTHGNLVANMQQASECIKPFVNPGNEVIVTALPLYHIFALTANCLTFMKVGAHNHLITNPRDMPNFVKELKKIRMTALTGVNTLFNGLLNTPGFSEVDFSGLKIVLGGGMAVQKAVAERWTSVTGTPLVEAYGLTETSPAATINPLDLKAYNGSIGLPVPSTECCIQNDEDVCVDVGEVGELCVRGPQVMPGYWQRPDETKKVLDEDGWLHTGDVARMDEEGFFYIVDRIKDLILVSGFNVYPNEVEGVVAEHPGVLEVGAIGVADDTHGEIVKIVVVKKDPALTEQALIEHCRRELTGYKVPRLVEFRDELPKTNVGKILRRELRDDS